MGTALYITNPADSNRTSALSAARGIVNRVLARTSYGETPQFGKGLHDALRYAEECKVVSTLSIRQFGTMTVESSRATSSPNEPLHHSSSCCSLHPQLK